MPLSNDEKLLALKAWQADENRHPYNCHAEDHSDHPLTPGIQEGDVVLFCDICGYMQTHSLDIAFDAYKGDHL